MNNFTSISKVILGSMHFSWTVNERQAHKLLDFYIQHGGNTIDTADIYTSWVHNGKGGDAEKIIGSWIKKTQNRKSIFISSKVGGKMWEGKNGEGLSQKHIIKACEESLKRLQTDYIDIYFAHYPDPNIPFEETCETFKSLLKQGKIKSFGLSNYSGEVLYQALDITQKINLPCSFIQAYYNILDHENFEKNIQPHVKKNDLSVLSYGGLANGFLTDTTLPSTHPRSVFLKEMSTSKNLMIKAVLLQIAQKYHCTISQVVLSWLLSKPYIKSIITGAETVTQLKENLNSQLVKLDIEDFKKINKVY